METIPYGAFYNCSSLKKVVFPASLKTIENNAFDKCRKLTECEISSDSRNYICKNGMLLSKDQKKAVWTFTGRKKIQIPEGVKVICSAAFANSYVKSISVPASVKRIEDYALSGKRIQKITISEKNKWYAIAGECIYNRKTGCLTACVVTDGILILPKEVKYLSENVSHTGKSIEKLVIPKTLKGFRKNCFRQGLDMAVYAKICLEAEVPPKAVKDGFAEFTTYYVPEKSLREYQEWYCETEELEKLKDGTINFVGY